MTAPIPALSAVRALQAHQSFAGGRDLRPGELLRLQVVAAADGTLLGADGDGLQLPLPGLGGQAAPGDVLLLRVLSQRPRLELQLVERQPGGSAPAALRPSPQIEDSPALRSDQAWLARQHLVGAPPALPQPAAVAVQWRAQVLGELQQLAGSPDPAPPWAAAQDAAPLILQLPGWQNQAVLLRLLLPLHGQLPWPAVDADGGHGETVGDDGSALMLCLGLALDGDWVQVLLLWDHGLLLHFSADEAATLERVRELLPAMASALAAVPLRLRSCLLSVRGAAPRDAPAARLAAGLADTRCAALFRAAAELVKQLQRAPLAPARPA